MEIVFVSYESPLKNTGQKLDQESWCALPKKLVYDFNFKVRSVLAKFIYLNFVSLAEPGEERVWTGSFEVIKRTVKQRDDLILKALKELNEVGLIKIREKREDEKGIEKNILSVGEICQDKISQTPNAKKISEDQKIFIDVWNQVRGEKPSKKYVLDRKQKKRIDEIMNTYNRDELWETMQRIPSVDDSGWTTGKADFHWLLRANHFDKLADNGYKLKEEDKVKWI